MSLDTNLLDSIKTSYLDPKIRGEDKNKQLLFLVCASIFTKNPLSAIVKGPSGAGKSWLVNRILDVFRKMGVVIEFSRVTAAFLDNMANAATAVPAAATGLPPSGHPLAVTTCTTGISALSGAGSAG